MGITNGDSALISIREYDIISGELISHTYPDTSDYLSHRIKYNKKNLTILYPLMDSKFHYINYNSKSKSYHLFSLDKNGHKEGDEYIDTISFEKYFNPDSVYQSSNYKMLKISEDSLITLDYIFNDDPNLNKQTKLTLYNKKLERKRIFNIDSLINYESNILNLYKANHNHVYITGKIEGSAIFNDTVFYSIFNWEGQLEKQFTTIYNNENHTGFDITYLEKEKEFLILSLSNDVSSIDFLITNSENKLNLIKSFKFKNNYIYNPNFIAQLKNGDILIKGYQKLKVGNQWLGNWPTWLRIKAEDLGLISSNNDLTHLPLINFKVYPNPVKNNLTIKFQESFSGNIQFSDELGRIIMNENIKNKIKVNLNVSKFSKGIYFIEVINNKSNITYTAKTFVKE